MTKNAAVEILLRRVSFKDSCQKLMKWDTSKSLKDNADALRIHLYACRAFAANYGLDFKRLKFKKALDRKKISQLLKLGFSYQQVGRVFRVTRQRIEQIEKEGK